MREREREREVRGVNEDKVGERDVERVRKRERYGLRDRLRIKARNVQRQRVGNNKVGDRCQRTI